MAFNSSFRSSKVNSSQVDRLNRLTDKLNKVRRIFLTYQKHRVQWIPQKTQNLSF